MAKIQPGLERIAELLKNVDFPWKSIHVAGTNGKGSICHHAASIITGNTIRVGKFTSPHLVDRCVCRCLFRLRLTNQMGLHLHRRETRA